MPRRFVTRDRLRRTPAVLGTAVAAMAVTAALGAAAAPRSQAPAAGHPAVSRPAASGRMALFLAAAKESGVPAGLLLAIGYNESRWEPHGTTPSADGGYGLMNLTTRTGRPAPARRWCRAASNDRPGLYCGRAGAGSLRRIEDQLL
jgi:soluble lytic murein transglycosylase-like protein